LVRGGGPFELVAGKHYLCDTANAEIQKISEGAPVLVDGQRVWTTMQELDFDTSDFAAKGFVVSGRVAKADAYLMRARELIDFGVSWLSDIRAKTAAGRRE
jgi:aminoglycoside N3'-acetyltransferase